MTMAPASPPVVYNKQVYALVDTRAGCILGGLHLFPHDAPAVRFFGDLAADPQTMIGRHPNDHQLVQIGVLDEFTQELVGSPIRVVITGAAWLAAQQPQEK